MAVLRIVQPPMLTPEVYDAVNAAAKVEENPPEGLLMHTAGEMNGAWQIVDVWESEDHARRFDEDRLTPAISEVTGMDRPQGSPEIALYELHKLIRP
jgi:hypothetical protein